MLKLQKKSGVTSDLPERSNRLGQCGAVTRRAKRSTGPFRKAPPALFTYPFFLCPAQILPPRIRAPDRIHSDSPDKAARIRS